MPRMRGMMIAFSLICFLSISCLHAKTEDSTASYEVVLVGNLTLTVRSVEHFLRDDGVEMVRIVAMNGFKTEFPKSHVISVTSNEAASRHQYVATNAGRMEAHPQYASEQHSAKLFHRLCNQNTDKVDNDPSGQYSIIFVGHTPEDGWYEVHPSTAKTGWPPKDRILQASNIQDRSKEWVIRIARESNLSLALTRCSFPRRPISVAQATYRPPDDPEKRRQLQQIFVEAQAATLERIVERSYEVRLLCGSSLEWERFLQEKHLALFKRFLAAPGEGWDPANDCNRIKLYTSALAATDWLPETISHLALVFISFTPMPTLPLYDDNPAFDRLEGRDELAGQQGRNDGWASNFGQPCPEVLIELERLASTTKNDYLRDWAKRALFCSARQYPELAEIVVPLLCKDLSRAWKPGYASVIEHLGMLGRYATNKQDARILDPLRKCLIEEMNSDNIYRIASAMRVMLCSRTLWDDKELRTLASRYVSDDRRLVDEMPLRRPTSGYSESVTSTGFSRTTTIRIGPPERVPLTHDWQPLGQLRLSTIARWTVKKSTTRYSSDFKD